MIQISSEDQQILDVLRHAVAETLERKRRLGQYAIVWRDGKPVMLGGKSDASNPSRSVAPPKDSNRA
ncbi:hypothetical protein ThidrDRAFT_4356 [Thiorhodococcus drewsii AZ1]|uniref:Uncharacterized protein n=1 Tax=Thiorhodococcus drewsii AZ1 TaxID=765913 RepID=G2E7U3_9GAMM|nr:hypothetical protein [Thiorhodococcus drewsii]EGV27818.1 hypothetical protein ThidrDRAFT_4356 [Thiorhodococcus drewsii AZ1]